MKILRNYKGIENCTCIDLGKGPKVSVFGGIHGDEISGVEAIKKILGEIESGKIQLQKGKVFLVGPANEQAYEKRVRFVHKNMNRLFYSNKELGLNVYECKRVEELKRVIDESDYLLDLHSTSSESEPFIFVEKQHKDFAQSLSCWNMIGGWSDLGSTIISGDTEQYMNSLGGVGVTFEAGSHYSDTAISNSYNMILSYLSQLGIYLRTQIQQKTGTYFHITDVYVAKTYAFSYLKEEKNFSFYKRGELLGYDGKEKIFAPYDMYMIMPTKQDKIKKGEEVFFISKMNI